jgi:hypothetical protein
LLAPGGLSAPVLPAATELGRLARKLEEAPIAEPKKAINLAEIAAEIVAAISRGVALTARQLRQAPWCLWQPDLKLAADSTLLDRILDQIARSKGRRPFHSLASAFLTYFRLDLPGLRTVARYLAQIAARFGDHWSRLQEDFGIFDPDNGPQRLAAAVIAENRSAREILAGYRLQAMDASGGYAQAVTVAILDDLAQSSDGDHLGRLARVELYALRDGREPLHEALNSKIAEALLRPLEDRPPDKATRDRFLQVILSIYGDPRLRRKRRLIPSPYDRIVIGWLTEQSLRQFLAVIEATTNKPEMFQYRQAFWLAAYKKRMISAAWVAYGPEGIREVRALKPEVAFAKLFKQDKQVQSGHAVLLMEIGSGIVADWSHDGMCNIWLDSKDSSAPKLFEERYGSNDVQVPSKTKSREAFRHTHPSTYSWQGKAARYLKQMTGIQLTESDYRL